MIILMVTFETEMAIHQLPKERWIIACFLRWLVSLCVWTFEFSNAIAATTGNIKHFGIWWCSKPPLRWIDVKTTWVCSETSVTTFDCEFSIFVASYHFILSSPSYWRWKRIKQRLWVQTSMEKGKCFHFLTQDLTTYWRCDALSLYMVPFLCIGLLPSSFLYFVSKCSANTDLFPFSDLCT